MGQVYKSAGIEAAKIGGLDPTMDAAALRTKAAVLAVAAGHTKTGGYASRVKVRNVRGRSGVRDRVVESTDRAAMHIEYGHWWVTPSGVRVKWIKGIRIFNRAYSIMKKG